MSKNHVEKIKCKKCGKESDYLVWEIMDTNIDPQMKEQIRNGEAFRWHCPHCDNNSLIFYPTIYHQVSDKYLLCYVPGDPTTAEKCMRDLEKDPGDSGYTFDSSFTKRVVYDMNQLREKLMILDEGLDDRVIEIMKIFIAANVFKHKPEHQIVDFLFHADENGERSFAIRFDNESWGSAAFVMSSYDQIAEQFKKILAKNDEFIIDSEWALNTINKEI
ncbi:MAG: CpXC domain-containing protein [Ruminococcus sp.]|uniref:CpXC domain-containing protein n=1 Tax=Ruminococcus sp. TaxID=41978 RepID=UPI0025D6A6F2|nr:CpXC domain-containing protein [Ruminococcus sp.]MCR5600234.1 CpXC domain-containing protein [Ruminococcus sp.]